MPTEFCTTYQIFLNFTQQNAQKCLKKAENEAVFGRSLATESGIQIQAVVDSSLS